MSSLASCLRELESKISRQEVISPAVSIASVGWHIEHSLLTLNLIIERLKTSDAKSYKWTFNFTRILVFTTNKIPRGRAKSPDVVVPKSKFDVDTLTVHIGVAKARILELDTFQTDNFFEHPYFGKLNLRPTIKFLEIHTQHHLAIINDILKSPPVSLKQV